MKKNLINKKNKSENEKQKEMANEIKIEKGKNQDLKEEKMKNVFKSKWNEI